MDDPEDDDTEALETEVDADDTGPGDIPPALDPHLVIRANAVGVTPEDLQELDPKAAEKLVAKIEDLNKRNKPKEEEPAPEEDDDLKDEDGFDPKLTKYVRGTREATKALQAELRETTARAQVREFVEDAMEDSTDLTADLKTPKHRNAVVKALVEIASDAKNAGMTKEQLYKAAEKQALGDKMKAKANKVVPSATNRPNAQPAKPGRFEATMARVLAANK